MVWDAQFMMMLEWTMGVIIVHGKQNSFNLPE